MILQLFPELTVDDVIVRGSGAGGEDLILSARARGLLPVSFECKSVERLELWSALEQAESNAEKWQPVVAFRRNRVKHKVAGPYAVIDLAQLLALLRIAAAWNMSQEPHEGLKNGS